MSMIRSRRLALGAMVSIASVVSLTATAGASTGTAPAANRLAGSNRYDTARVIASADWGAGGAAIAVIASGTNYPDALASAYLAGRVHGPILTTDPNNLSPEALQALQFLKTTGVDLVGGPSAVSQNVANQLNAQGYTVNRIFGPDRYGTAQAIDELFQPSFVGDLGSMGQTAIVVTGLNFADALAAGGMSDAGAFPIVLTDPNSLPASSKDVLTKEQIRNVVIVGGTAAVSDAVAQQIQGMGITVQRVAGADRTDTAAQLAEQIEIPMLGFTNARALLARGDDFGDALPAAPDGALVKAPLVLTENPSTLGTFTTNWFHSHRSTMANIDVIGGTSAVNDSTVAAAQAAATG